MSESALDGAIDLLLTALADDELIMGHRASEWTGLGPLLEADLALSSIAQDEMGHALLFYSLLHERGAPDPDAMVYQRTEGWRCAQLCELPRRDWGETLVRHFLYDLAEQVRLEALASSSYEPLKAIAGKLRGEERYHLAHGRTWLRQLAQGTTESHARLQAALDELLPYALGLWEPLEGEALLASAGIIPPMATLAERWWQAVQSTLAPYFALPAFDRIEPVYGGRQGRHSEHFAAILDALQMLHREIPGTSW